MNATGITSFIRRKTKTTTSTYPDADLLVDINTFMDELAGRIQQVRPSIWNIPATFALEADQREYAFPSDTLNNIVSLELDFGSGYVPATPMKKNPSGFALTEAQIVATFSSATPEYFIRRKAIYILSGAVPSDDEGGKLVYNAFPKNLTSLSGSTDLSVDPSTTEHGFPREFHELLARRVSIHYKDLNDIKLSKEDASYDKDLEKKLDEFSVNNLDTAEIAQVPSGASLGNNGFDY